jgi:uncharacterized membrane protein (DUF2068 family)
MRTRPANRYELLSCALNGHVLVGTDAAEVLPSDALIVRQPGDTRWCRCLRCDGWFPMAPPAEPARQRVPTRDEIEVPLRGPLLRDRYVLRLIAIDRAIHVVILSALAVVILVFIGDHRVIVNDYDRIMNSLTGGPNGNGDLGGLLSHFHHYLLIKPQHLYEVLIVVLLYAALEATEMVGLWLTKRWAEYLTFVATVLLIPLEVYELAHHATVLKAATFVLNVAIALYLLLAKRLFGLRGGHRAEHERRVSEGGWSALERVSAAAEGSPAAVPAPSAQSVTRP